MEVEEEVHRERMREVVKNVKGRVSKCVKAQIYRGSHRWGRMVGVSRLQRRLPLSLIY